MRSFRRIRASSASCSVLARSRTRIWVGSVRPPAAPTTISFCLRRRHQAISSTLTRKASQASMTRSNGPARSSVMLAGVTNEATVSTFSAGLMARQRSAMASTLLRPKLPSSACNCRLLLDTQMSSASNRLSRPMPERASASTSQDPTPPMPMTATWACPSRAKAPLPYSRSTPAKRSL